MRKKLIYVVCVLTSELLMASAIKPKSFEAMVKETPLIFEGEVTKIEYKNSKGDNISPNGIPHTFVTYKVVTPISGKVTQTFTLRFLGGLNKDGIATQVGDNTSFDLGERDFLFVKGNTKMACPLFQCNHGRLRVENGKVFSEEGRSVLKGPNNNIAFGNVQNLKSLATHTYVHPTTQKSVTVQKKGSVFETVAPEANQFTSVDFANKLKAQVQSLPEPTPEITASVSQDFGPISLMPSKPTNMPLETAVSPQDAQEKIEQAKLKLSNGNPVIQ